MKNSYRKMINATIGLMVVCMIAISFSGIAAAQSMQCAIYGLATYDGSQVSGIHVSSSDGISFDTTSTWTSEGHNVNFKLDGVTPNADLTITYTYNGMTVKQYVHTPASGNMYVEDMPVPTPTPVPTATPTPVPTTAPVSGGIFEFQTASANVLSGTVTVNVIRTGSTASTSTVQVGVDGASTAVSGTDYTMGQGQLFTLTFGPGENVKPVTINVIGNHSGAAAKTVLLSLSSPSSGASIGTPGAYTLNIGDQPVVTATPTATPTNSPTITPTPAATPTLTPTPTPTPATENTSTNWMWLLLLLLIPLAGIAIYYFGFVRNK